MADEHVVVEQQPEGRFALDHGALAVQGADGQPAIRHDVSGAVVHGTAAGRPLVHMVCWDQEEPFPVEVRGTVGVTGDPDAPVHVRMRHEFAGDHHQTHAVEPLDHSLRVETGLAQPIHHALQMRTPLEVRFCNPWHVASDYRLEVNLGRNRVIGIRLTGATVATPQPCEPPCPPAESKGMRP